jgi:hypothetical protein
MKIHYREFTLIEKMQIAIRDSKKPILYFEITQKEFDANYSRFDRSQQQDNSCTYSCKGIEIKVKNKNED